MQRIFIGDVQGCAEELDALLARAHRAFGSQFELWAVGDLVNRGPRSREVLERVHALWSKGRAQCVLGNHEIALIRTAFGLRRPGPADTLDDILDHPDADAWVAWLRRLPLVVEGELQGQPFAMVHAALDPRWSLASARKRAARLEAQLGHDDPARARALLAGKWGRRRDRDALGRMLSCRSVDAKGGWTPEEPSGSREAWHQAWSRHGHAYGVVYGHWSLQALHVAPKLRGLDTGCVHHGRGRDGFLTAWVPDGRPSPFGVPDDRFWHEKARARYYRGCD